MNVQEFVSNVDKKLAEMGKPKGEFYNAIGISSAAYSSWKTGRSAPSQINVNKIASFLCVSVDELTKENAVATEDDCKEDVIQRISDLLMRVDLQTLHAVRDFADGLIRWREFQQSSTAQEEAKKDN